jgi:hypothetical protein
MPATGNGGLGRSENSMDLAIAYGALGMIAAASAAALFFLLYRRIGEER